MSVKERSDPPMVQSNSFCSSATSKLCTKLFCRSWGWRFSTERISRDEQSCNLLVHSSPDVSMLKPTNGSVRHRCEHSPWLMSNQENGHNSIETIAVMRVFSLWGVKCVRFVLHKRTLCFLASAVQSTEVKSLMCILCQKQYLIWLNCSQYWIW